jgi:hypothetical protein
LSENISCCRSEYEAAEGADAIVLVTEWNQFRALDFERLKSIMRAPVMIDLRNIYRVEEMTAHGFRYYRVGAPQLIPTMPISVSAGSIPFRPRQRVDAGLPRTNGSTPKAKSRRRIVETRSGVSGAR